jgi:hypothetical protein
MKVDLRNRGDEEQSVKAGSRHRPCPKPFDHCLNDRHSLTCSCQRPDSQNVTKREQKYINTSDFGGNGLSSRQIILCTAGHRQRMRQISKQESATVHYSFNNISCHKTTDANSVYMSAGEFSITIPNERDVSTEADYFNRYSLYTIITDRQYVEKCK